MIIVGPVCVSNSNDTPNAPKAATRPISAAIMAIASGVFASGRAAAAGMISNVDINNAPTTLIATATTIAKVIVKASCSRLALMPLACARSGLSVEVSNACHRQAIRATTVKPPPQISAKSCLETAKISPTKYAIRSTRTPLKSETLKRPMASIECAKTPSNVSSAKPRSENVLTASTSTVSMLRKRNTVAMTTVIAKDTKVSMKRDAKMSKRKGKMIMPKVILMFGSILKMQLRGLM